MKTNCYFIMSIMTISVKNGLTMAWLALWNDAGKCCPSVVGGILDQGWGLLKLRSSISPQAKFSISQKYMSCSDTCQIWMWYSKANMYFGDVEKLKNDEKEVIGLVTPNPVPQHIVRVTTAHLCAWMKPSKVGGGGASQYKDAIIPVKEFP